MKLSGFVYLIYYIETVTMSFIAGSTSNWLDIQQNWTEIRSGLFGKHWGDLDSTMNVAFQSKVASLYHPGTENRDTIFCSCDVDADPMILMYNLTEIFRHVYQK